MTATILVNSNYVVSTTETPTFGDGTTTAYSIQGPYNFTDNGAITVTSVQPGAAAVAIGTISTSATNISLTANASVTVSADGNAEAVVMVGGIFNNAGAIAVTSTHGIAIGLQDDTSNGIPPGNITNSGTIIASGPNTVGVELNGSVGNAALSNSGTISGGTGIAINQANQGYVATITNTGSIGGGISSFTHPVWYTLDLTNSGSIQGGVYGGPGSTIRNTGSMTDVYFNSAGGDVYDGRGGTLTGAIWLTGDGDTAYLGDDGETVHGGVTTRSIIHGGLGADTIVGGGGADFIAGGGGNDTITGGLGADVFMMSSNAGAATITDFSDAQGDKIDLSAFGTFHSLSDVLAVATQVNSDTVITIGSRSLTLDNVQLSSLTDADFIYGPISVTGALTIAAGQNLTFSGTNGGHGAYAVSGTGTLKVYGTVLVQDTQPGDILPGVNTSGSTGNPVLWIETGGSFTVNASGSGASAYGFYSGQASANFQNDGTFSVSSAGGVIGVDFQAGGGFLNHGSMTITGQSGFTSGLYAAGSFQGGNTGSINVSGSGRVDAVDLVTNAIFTNAGTITATSSGGAAYGILAGDSAGALVNITNSGTITAQYAINSIAGAGPIGVANSGTLNGAVLFGTSAGNELFNTGAIHGAVTFGGTSSLQYFDGRGGTLSGGITFASGSGVTGTAYAYLGNDGETVQGGSAYLHALGGTGADHITGGAGAAFIEGGGGNDVLNGGSSGASTVIFAPATNGVTVSLALQGQAQNTGEGTDTLSNFRNMVGSTFNDHLTGDANNNIMEGDGGDDVMDGGGGFNTVAFAGATHGVTVSLALQGQAQDTGIGQETLTNFQAIQGSGYNDTLEGGGPLASSLTGGLGADTFVYRPGDGHVTIQDFSAAEGDKIDLSSVFGFRSLSDVQAHLFSANGGVDSVIAIEGAGLLLGGVAPGSLEHSPLKLMHIHRVGSSCHIPLA